MNKSPKAIRKKMLSPTDKTNFSVKPNLFNLRITMRRNPGTRVRKRNPNTGRNKGIFNSTAKSVAIRNNIRRKNVFGIFIFTLLFVRWQVYLAQTEDSGNL